MPWTELYISILQRIHKMLRLRWLGAGRSFRHAGGSARIREKRIDSNFLTCPHTHQDTALDRREQIGRKVTETAIVLVRTEVMMKSLPQTDDNTLAYV